MNASKMKIAVLQLDPKLGQREANIARADEILVTSKVATSGVNLLVLPEMAFTGYAFPSRKAIDPYLEATSAGPSTKWAIETARRLRCHVCVGYPERSTAEPDKNFNSMVTVDPHGEVVVNYRKTFLFETDETWAEEGPGFLVTTLPGLNHTSRTPSSSGNEEHGKNRVVMGICMDLSPYRFEAPFNKFEFGNHVVNGQASLVITCMAWLTHASVEEVVSRKTIPAFDTVSYWALRLTPLIEKADEKETVVVFANRCGVENGNVKATEGIPAEKDANGEQLIRFAGSSCVMGFKAGKVRVWDVLGRGEEALLVVDTSQPSKYALTDRNEEHD